MPTPIDQLARSLRLALQNHQGTAAGEWVVKELLFKHRHLIAATLERLAEAQNRPPVRQEDRHV